MAINKKLIHFNKKEDFDREVANGNILDHSIVFVKDSKEIYTHGTSYGSIKWSIIESNTHTFTVEGYEEEFTFEEGMTWYEFCESEYNILGWIAYPDQIETYYLGDSSTPWGYSEWGWLELEDEVWFSGEVGANALIIPNHHYYEHLDSSGVGGGGDWSLDKQNEPSKEE